MPITISFGGYQPNASVHNRAAESLGQALRTSLGDAVQFELDGNIIASGHQAVDLLAMVESGAMTMCYFSASYLAARVPEFALLDLPFRITSRDQAYAILEGACGQLLVDKLLANTGFRILGWWDNGFRHLTNAVRPIYTPADCLGLRIRTLLSDVHQRVFTLLGFNPVALDVKDLQESARISVVDAQENPLTNTYNFGIHRYHPYVTLSGHFFGAAALLCHQASYAAWPEEVRQAVDTSACEATRMQRRFAVAEDDDILRKVRLDGNDIVQLTDAERALFVAAVAPMIEEQHRRFGKELCGPLET
ncbi:MAG TPA: TRAP transporter substrate-binding protein [Candidatus Tectomicrobia bacterium]|nr:TRAP transporter substrate-binding protein [Candidatus Tectomicrobia bacterium]